MNLISNDLVQVLEQQWAHETYNSHLYAYIMAFLKNKGLNHLAGLFFAQYKEEQSHATMILDLLTDLNADVTFPKIDGCSIKFGTIVDIANIYLEREILTTKSLDEIKVMAMDTGNPVVEERIRTMILLQQAEYAEATDFLDKATIIGSDWKLALLLDASLGE